MDRTLSSPATAALKFVLSPLWVGLCAWVGWQIWARPGEVLVDHEAGTGSTVLRVVLLVLLALGLVVLFVFVVPLKRVRLRADALLVSSFRREITIPFTTIARVRQAWLPTFRLVTLDLRASTPFGHRVLFLPAGRRPFAFWRPEYWREDDVVSELRRLTGLADR